MRINHISRLFVLIILCFQSCDTEKKAAEEKPSKKEETSAKLSYEIKSISEKANDCPEGVCTEVKINYPVFEGQKKINEVIESRVKASLADFIMEAEGDEDLSALTDMFMKNYEEFKESFPESQTPWTVDTDVIVSAMTPDYITLAFNTSSYTGGAHPNSSIEYVNVTPSGKVISNLDYFFQSPEKVREIAEKQFRTKYNLSPTDNLAEKGFVFDNDKFSLSENFGFTDSAIIFYYNSYDIASYAQGPTALLIPLYTLKDNYKF